ncbi:MULTISPECIES: DivIVA domain-containing protein [unclassified Frankia]
MVLVIEIVIVAAVVFAVAALAVGRFDRLAPAPPDGAPTGLPVGTVTAGDIARTRFGMALRGYRMAEVDAVLLRLADELAWRDEELVRLAAFARVDTAPSPDGHRVTRSPQIDE